MRIFCLIVISTALLCAQTYLEAIGQTEPFTLSAGSGSSWDPTVANEKTVPVSAFANPALSIFPNPGNGNTVIRVKGARGKALVSLYDVAGKKLADMDVSRTASAVVPLNLADGIYFARLAVNGRRAITTRFLLVR